jgi:hypothetical protein
MLLLEERATSRSAEGPPVIRIMFNIGYEKLNLLKKNQYLNEEKDCKGIFLLQIFLYVVIEEVCFSFIFN